jgi:hypothetical protein
MIFIQLGCLRVMEGTITLYKRSSLASKIFKQSINYLRVSGLNVNRYNSQNIFIRLGCLLVIEGTITSLQKIVFCNKDLQAIKQLEGEQLDCETAEFSKYPHSPGLFTCCGRNFFFSTEVFSCFEELQTIKQLDSERLECKPISFVTQVMYQSRLLVSGEEELISTKSCFFLLHTSSHKQLEVSGSDVKKFNL